MVEEKKQESKKFFEGQISFKMKSKHKRYFLILFLSCLIILGSSTPSVKALTLNFIKNIPYKKEGSLINVRQGAASNYFEGRVVSTAFQSYAEVTKIKIWWLTEAYEAAAYNYLKWVKVRVNIKVGTSNGYKNMYVWGPGDDESPWTISDTDNLYPNFRIYGRGTVKVAIETVIYWHFDDPYYPDLFEPFYMGVSTGWITCGYAGVY